MIDFIGWTVALWFLWRISADMREIREGIESDRRKGVAGEPTLLKIADTP